MPRTGPRRHLRAVRLKLQVPYAAPDFLSSVVALAKFVRLSLQKAAYVALGGTAMQEIRVRSSRDDKVERGGTPWHEWTWMGRFEKANLDKTDSQPSPSTSSGQALRD